MKIRIGLVSTVLLVLAVAAFPLPASGSPTAPAQRPQNVDAELWQALARGGASDLVVEFSEQADLSAAYGMDWAARGEYVVETLQAVAERVQAGAVAHAENAGLRHKTFLAGNELYIWDARLETVLGLASLHEVAYVRAPQTIFLDPILGGGPDNGTTKDWGITDTKADQFWAAFGVQGDGIVVASIDTGVQWNHPALVNAFKCPGAPSNPACWSDPSNICGGSACDNYGHGTHTMGTMVADDNPGLPYIAGMAPNAKWIACKGCEYNWCSDFALNSCADWILAPGGNPANRPHVVNNSWGGGGCDNWYLSKVQAWRAAGIFPAFAAGNGYNCNSLGSPGDYQESFGSASHNSSRTISSFSSKGPSCYGDSPYIKPNLSAPGEYICSTVPTNSWTCGWSGTSMASPHTAGAVALLWSCNPALVGQIDQTFQLLQNSADTPPSGSCGPEDVSSGGNYTYGYGFLDVFAAGQTACVTGTMHVKSITMAGREAQVGGYNVRALIRIVDQNGAPVVGATVSARWTLPGQLTVDQQAVTDQSGVATFQIKSPRYGKYQICVRNVVKPGLIYKPADNLVTCSAINVR
jgi:subtilisin family serine protease